MTSLLYREDIIMSRQRDAELDRLKVIRESARQRQQAAWEAQQAAWERRSSARAVMNRAWEAKQAAYADQQAAWEAYMSIRLTNGPRIEILDNQQEKAYQEMKSAFESASLAYDVRDGASARMHANQGHACKIRSQTLAAERRQLVSEIRAARERFESAKPAFQAAKGEFARAQQTFHSARAEHELAEAEFKRAKADFESCTKAFRSRLDELKSASRKKHKELAAKAGVPIMYQDDVWISTEPNGNVNIYFGGVDKPDGPGHGHYVMDRNGALIYRRNPFEPHGPQNFESGGTLYDRRARRDTPPLGVRNRDNDTNDRSGVLYDRNRQIDLHVTQYYGDNYRISWDTDGESDKDHHWTNQSLPYGHPDRHNPPEDAR